MNEMSEKQLAGTTNSEMGDKSNFETEDSKLPSSAHDNQAFDDQKI